MFSQKYFFGQHFAPKFWTPSGAGDVSRYVQLTDLTTAKGLGAGPDIINYVMVQAQTNNVRYRDDGIAPTATVGFILYAGDPPTKFAGAIDLLQFIQTAAGTAQLNVRFY